MIRFYDFRLDSVIDFMKEFTLLLFIIESILLAVESILLSS